MKRERMESLIGRIIRRELGKEAGKITRQTTGFCNDVYSVALPKGSVIIRLNRDPQSILGSRKYIPIFRKRGIKVPVILGEDYSRETVPYAYQIMTRFPGRDLGQVIKGLTGRQLHGIAGHVASVFRKLRNIPTNGKYGYVGAQDKKGVFPSWTAYMRHGTERDIYRGRKTGVIDEDMVRIIRKIFADNRAYFDGVPSKFYFDDISSKNVMVYRGKFSGIVDLDGVTYGDYLEAVGRIAAGWHGTRYGDVYAKAVMDELKLSKEQRKIVAVYAVLNRFDWLCEWGWRFNRDTSGKIDWRIVKRDKRIIRSLARAIES